MNPLTPYFHTPLQKIIITSEILLLAVSSPVVLESSPQCLLLHIYMYNALPYDL